MNMPGLAYPLDTSSRDPAEEVVCYFGIIDILQAIWIFGTVHVVCAT
jgi:hypothetical protein